MERTGLLSACDGNIPSGTFELVISCGGRVMLEIVGKTVKHSLFGFIAMPENMKFFSLHIVGNFRSQAIPMGHQYRIRLWFPIYQIGRDGMSDGSIGIIQTPDGVPLPIRCLKQERVVHPFLRTPSAVVRSQKGVFVADSMPVILIDTPCEIQSPSVLITISKNICRIGFIGS